MGEEPVNIVVMEQIPGVRLHKRWLLSTVFILLVTAGIGGASYYLQVPVTGSVEDVAEQNPIVQAPFTSPGSGYTGVSSCIDCHQEQYRLWRGSHHDLAMQVASDATVLGNFNEVRFDYNDVTSRFYREDKRFVVNTDGPDGALHDYEIKYTFGVFPLQQYLIELPGGRLQALGIAWDSRPTEQGGQRWFHLYPDDRINHDDELHWTAPNQNWNYMCAECHSTQLRKNYNATSGRFETVWSEINVACEACHGPGANHIQWAQGDQDKRRLDGTMGLNPLLRERANVTWTMDAETGTARRSEARTSEIEINTCAPCHSRRGIVNENYEPGDNLMNTHRPALLDEGLYYADGQILDEVYVYGSFRQSKMYHTGVTCSDCHEVHSLKLRGTRETVCLQCHLAEKYASKKHHFHEPASAGASCVACHMQEKKYMVIDPRFDHSIRIPRPDLSVRLDVPNSCNYCHADQTSQWSAEFVRQWYPEPATGFQEYAQALNAGRLAAPEAAGLLIELAAREDQPAIARATALHLLGQFPVPQSLQVISDSLYDVDPLVRFGGVQTLEAMQPNIRYQLAAHLLNDPIRTVRIEAARVLAGTPDNQLNADQKNTLSKALEEYRASLEINAERPEALVSMGNLTAVTARFNEAEKWFLAAIETDQRFAPAYVNLADLYRVMGRERDAQDILNRGLNRLADEPSLHHALGLSLVRDHQLSAAVESLGKAAELASANSRYGYIYAIALDATGDTDKAIDVLSGIYRKDNNAQQVLSALIGYLQKKGNSKAAEKYQEEMNSWQQRFNGALHMPTTP